MKAGMGKEALIEQGWEFNCDIPFDSERKRMSVVYPIIITLVACIILVVKI